MKSMEAFITTHTVYFIVLIFLILQLLCASGRGNLEMNYRRIQAQDIVMNNT